MKSNKINKRIFSIVLAVFTASGIFGGTSLPVTAVEFEAKIGDVYYETLEEAFQNINNGDTITVLKDCGISSMLEVNAEDVTLQSLHAENPVVIIREDRYSDQPFVNNPSYGTGYDYSLLAVASGSLTIKNIILDGSAVKIDGSNHGFSWKSPLVYVAGSCTLEKGGVLRNNFNLCTDSSLPNRTGGAVHVMSNGSFCMKDGLISTCLNSGGAGGGIQGAVGSEVIISGGTIHDCQSSNGGAVAVFGNAEISNAIFTENYASHGGAIYGETGFTMQNCTFQKNEGSYGGGGIYVSGMYNVTVNNCTFTENTSRGGSAVSVKNDKGTETLTIRDCSFLSNEVQEYSSVTYGGTINYAHKGSIMLDGIITMKDNTIYGGANNCDIMYGTNSGPVILGKNFSSEALFSFSSSSAKSGRLMVDAATNGIHTDAIQFSWSKAGHRTTEKNENIYLDVYPKTYYTALYQYNGGSGSIKGERIDEGENAILPFAYREGYRLTGWYEDELLTVRAGDAWDTYPLSQNMTFYAGWEEGETDLSAYEAKIDKIYFKTIEAAFDAAKAGDTIVVLKNCHTSKTLEVKTNNITLTSENSDTPIVIRRDSTFSGKNYEENADKALLGINSGSIVLHDIILDGGAVIDKNSENIGDFWNGPLIYIKGSCTMDSGAVLQNNYNGNEPEYGDYRTGGAVHVAEGGTFIMKGGLINQCHTSGEGGGILAMESSTVNMSDGSITNCSATNGGGIEFWGTADISGILFSDNYAVTDGGAIYGSSSTRVTDCRFEKNKAGFEGGAIAASLFYDVNVSDCAFNKNEAKSGTAIQAIGGSSDKKITITKCSFTENIITEPTRNGSIIDYMHGSLLLNDSIVMKDNMLRDGKDADIMLFDTDTGVIVLGDSFSSESIFTLGCKLPESGMLLVDAATNEIDTDNEQFIWYNEDYRTTKIDKNIYLKDAPIMYTITYETNGGECNKSQDLVEESLSITLPPCTRENYDFTGWYEDSALTILVGLNGEDYTPTHNTSLYAGWQYKEATITLDPNGGQCDTDNLTTENGYATLPSCTKNGYDFLGWFENEALTTLAGKAGDSYMPGTDKTLYAKWEEKSDDEDISGNDPDDKKEYLITFNPGEGSCDIETAKTENGVITLPLCTRNGYDFSGWFEDDLLTKPAGKAGDTYSPSDNVTLYAKWTQKDDTGGDTGDDDNKDISGNDPDAKKEYLITFNPGEGSCGITSAKTENGVITLPDCTRDGYDFSGWFEDDLLTKPAGKAGDTYSPSDNVTLYAKWTQKDDSGGDTGDDDNEDISGNDPDDKKEYLITFNPGEGSCGITSAKTENGVITLPDCTRDGYDFSGWFEDDLLTKPAGKAGDTYSPSDNVTLYAKWTQKDDSGEGTGDDDNKDISGNDTDDKKEYLITFNPGEGSCDITSAKTENGIITLPDCNRNGYEFLGWYEDSALTVFIGKAGELYAPNSDKILHAKWKISSGSGSKKITGNPNSPNSSSVNDEKKTNYKDNPEKTEKGPEPFPQTGIISPVPVLLLIGLYGLLLIIQAYYGIKKSK